MAGTTVIRNAASVVAWDAGSGQQIYLRDADVAFTASEITHVGTRFEGEAVRLN